MINKDKNKRISVTLPKKIFWELQKEAVYEDRTLSNMAAYIIKKHYRNKHKKK